jgi:hypothetical protein
MNATYLLTGIAAILLGIGRLIIIDLPGTAVRLAGRAGAPPPARFIRQALTGAGLTLVGAGSVAGAWASPAPGPLSAVGIVSAVLLCAGVALIIVGLLAAPYLGRQPWLGRLMPKALPPEGERGMSKSSRFRNMSRFSPRERIKGLLAGVIMSVSSLLAVAIGLSDPSDGVAFIVIGAFGSLFFVPATIFVLAGVISLRQRP